MQLQFSKNGIPYLQRVKGDTQTQEQTQELRLPEDMPDVGTVLGTWGQVLIRGKEWRGSSMELSCGVMAWAMYLPEGGGAPQMVEAWIPYNCQWDLPETDHDGTMTVSCLLRSVDARPVSARRLMLRASIGVQVEAWVPATAQISTPENVPQDICLLKKTYPVCLSTEAGEKAFDMEEELSLPPTAPKLEKLLRFSLQPELSERKVLAGKIVFRGVALLHILYQSPEGGLFTWDFQLPFSQYGELEQVYDQDADAQVRLAVTSLELDQDQEGRLCLKAGLTGQYVIQDRKLLELVEDAYSPHRSVTVEQTTVMLPMILQTLQQSIDAEQTVPVEGSRVADVTFWPDQCRQTRRPEETELSLSGQFGLLYYDHSGNLQGTTAKWHHTQEFPAAPESQISPTVTPEGTPQAVLQGDAVLRGQVGLCLQTIGTGGLPMITGMEIGEELVPDPGRPSLVLRRAGEDTLWTLAKATGSTVERIQQANDLQGEPDPTRMLLIPVV